MNFIQKIYESSPVVIQDLLLTGYGLKIYKERYGKPFKKMFQTVDRLQWASREEIENYQIRRIRKVVEHAYLYVPFYREHMRKNHMHYSDIKNLESLKYFPIIAKSQIKQTPHLFQSEKKQSLVHGHTSGTTGSPFDITYSRNVSVAMAVCDWRHMANGGRNPSDKIAILLGQIIVPIRQKKPPFWRHNYTHHEIWFSSFHLSNDNIDKYLKEMMRLKIKFLKAYPSTAYILARFCVERDKKIPLKAVFTSSETLYQHQREVIEKAFCCKVFDYYGHAERALFATECEQHSGMHINEDFGLIECVDKDGKSVKNKEIGMLVGTSLYNYAMPFIRYSTGDLSSIEIEKCSCGRSFKRMRAVTTKAEDIIMTTDGRMISSSILTHPFKPIDTIRESQIIQEELDTIIVKLVVDSNFTSEHQALLRNGIQDRVGPEVKIYFEKVDGIPREKNGKFRWVTSNVGLSPYRIAKEEEQR